MLRSAHHFRFIGMVLLAGAMLAGCVTSDPHKTDAELGLNAQQIRGRRVYEQQCAQCHWAFISRDLHGPSLKGIFKKPYLPSGTPANDDRVRDLIETGRLMMPAFGRVLTEQQVNDLIAYLHTL